MGLRGKEFLLLEGTIGKTLFGDCFLRCLSPRDVGTLERRQGSAFGLLWVVLKAHWV